MKSIVILLGIIAVATPLVAEARSPHLKEPSHCNKAKAWEGQDIENIMPKVKATKHPYRVVHEHGSMTDDFVIDRLTIIVDDEGTILDISCR